MEDTESPCQLSDPGRERSSPRVSRPSLSAAEGAWSRFSRSRTDLHACRGVRRGHFNLSDHVEQSEIVSESVLKINRDTAGCEKIISYKLDHMVSNTALLSIYAKGTVFRMDVTIFRTLLRHLLFMACVGGLLVATKFPDDQAVIDFPMDPIVRFHAIVDKFVPLVLGFYVATNMIRWWYLRKDGLGVVLDSVGSLCMLIGAEFPSAEWEEMRSKVAKHMLAAVELMIAAATYHSGLTQKEKIEHELSVWLKDGNSVQVRPSAAKRFIQEPLTDKCWAKATAMLTRTLESAAWAAGKGTRSLRAARATVRATISREADTESQTRRERDKFNADSVISMLVESCVLTEEEAALLENKDLWQRPFIVWSWIWQVLTQALNVARAPEPRGAMIMGQCVNARHGLDVMHTFTDTQLPFAYVHLVTLLINMETTITSTRLGLTFAQLAVQKDTLGCMLAVLHVVCVILMYQGLLGVTYMTFDPLGNDILDFPVRYYCGYMAGACDAAFYANDEFPKKLQERIGEGPAAAQSPPEPAPEDPVAALEVADLERLTTLVSKLEASVSQAEHSLQSVHLQRLDIDDGGKRRFANETRVAAAVGLLEGRIPSCLSCSPDPEVASPDAHPDLPSRSPCSGETCSNSLDEIFCPDEPLLAADPAEPRGC